MNLNTNATYAENLTGILKLRDSGGIEENTVAMAELQAMAERADAYLKMQSVVYDRLQDLRDEMQENEYDATCLAERIASLPEGDGGMTSLRFRYRMLRTYCAKLREQIEVAECLANI
jgi:hypothetical protein